MIRDIILIGIIVLLGMWFYRFYQANPQMFPFLNPSVIQNFNPNTLLSTNTLTTFSPPYETGFLPVVPNPIPTMYSPEGDALNTLLISYEQTIQTLEQALLQTTDNEKRSLLERNLTFQKEEVLRIKELLQ